MAKVRPTRRAREHIANLPFEVRESLDEAFMDLAAAPREAGYPLVGTREGDWAMRVLEYRVEYRILGSRDENVVVFSVLHREDAYPPARH